MKLQTPWGCDMPRHSAKSLFELNMESADECLRLFDGLLKLKTGRKLSWLLRAAVVFIVSAVDTYFHDKIKYRVGNFTFNNMPKQLGNFEIPIKEIEYWDEAERKGNVYRNWVTSYFQTIPLQSPDKIAESLKTIGIEAIWDTIEPNRGKKDILIQEFNNIVKRRNQIAHEGDREQSRTSGKALRLITRKEVDKYYNFSNSLINKIETAFPR